nr:hypothetical protein [Tanacetum cinerariifolium]
MMVKKLRMDNGLEFCNREFKQLCIERHPSDYGMLRIFCCVAYPHDKQGKLESRVVKCVLLGYPEGVKGYRLYRLDDQSPKIVTSRNVVFNESVMYKDTLKDSGVDYQLARDREPRTRTKPLRFRDESNMDAYAFVATEEKDTHEPLTYQEAVACEDSSKNVVFNESVMYKDTLKDFGACDKSVEGITETDQPPDLTDYQLARDREPRTRTKPLRFRDESNMVAYTFVAAEKKDTHEPLTYQKVVACEDSSKWKAVMKEDMDSLRKNKTWELVDHPARQKLVSCKWMFKIKEGIEGVQNSRYKARLVARAFTQRANDMLIACKSKDEIGSTKSLLKKEFDMKELGDAKKILGIEIVRDQSRKILRVSQSGYVSKILNSFRIDNGKSVKMPLSGHFKLSLKDCSVRDCDVERMSKVPYANAVGSLMYLMVCTRPYIAYVGCVVSWKATLQHVVALSTTEVEYMALMEAVKEAIWLRKLLEEEVLEAKTVKVLKVGTEHNVVDALTNVVP